MNTKIIQEIIENKKNGLSDKEIGECLGVNLKLIEKAITREMGVNISNPSMSKKKLALVLTPKEFIAETTTVWSFKSRGVWATHNGNYRGNWSPYIPRNVISRYSKENDLVVDYFCGAGTTAVECKLLNRDFIGVDINPHAITLAETNLDFEIPSSESTPQITLRTGDARKLDFIGPNTVDLICAHPPYSNIIQYTDKRNGDLSHLEYEDFLTAMSRVAQESFRILKDNHFCAILIGDMRKNKNVIPLGFWTINKYLEAGFDIKDLIIKRQHNCKTTGFWYNNSIKFNFLLLAHEYLVIFQKKTAKVNPGNREWNVIAKFDQKNLMKNVDLESTTVWIFPKKDWVKKTLSNIVKRYASRKYSLPNMLSSENQALDLIITNYDGNFEKKIQKAKKVLTPDGILAVICEDVRNSNDSVSSGSLDVERFLKDSGEFKIKEVVVVSIEGDDKKNDLAGNLNITHKYVLIYKKISNE